ncbi:F-box protein SKIP19-like [Cannabis sativa]|uniref:F-box protein SKIP19-like n=1 Tax=Cannabis sativa TaxID=3483 RepID=UPI0029C9CA5C|nr:F-box protein SKIP19-like [Cannabis sativa]
MLLQYGESWAVRVGIPSEVALAIASTMPKLKHLEISYMQLCNEDLLKILNSCAQLQYLDISECIFLKDVEILLKNFSALKVVPPFNDDYDYYSDFDKVYGYNDFEESYDYLFQ